MQYIRTIFSSVLILLLALTLLSACAQRDEQTAESAQSAPPDSAGDTGPADNGGGDSTVIAVPQPAPAPAAPASRAPEALEEPVIVEPLVMEEPMMMEAQEEPDYKIGNILYNPPTEMTLNVTETVEIRIGKDEVSREGLVGGGAVQQEAIPISETMSVRLCCGDSSKGDPFDIHFAGSEEQLVDSPIIGDDGYSEWVFQVTPRKKGQHQLQLIVSAHYTLSNGKTVSKDEVLNRQITVNVDSSQEAKSWLSQHWQWLGLLLVIPLAAFIISRRNKAPAKRHALSGDEAIFISYRRDDSSGYTLAIYEKLKSALGDEHVFMDMDDIPHGENFAKHIGKVLSKADTVLVMIGAGWLNATNARGRRLDDPGDYVRMEVATALAKDLRVIPVLLRGAEMPQQDALPDDLKELSMRNAIRIYDDQFDASIQRLIDSLSQ